MGRMRRFLRLSPWERRLLLRSALLLGGIRLGLSLLSFERLQGLLSRLRQPGAAPRPDPHSLERITWAVEAASRWVPAATCLTRALAAQVLFSQHHCPTELRIGVARNRAGALEAHAWLEAGQGKVVIGDSGDLGRYTLLPSLGERP